MTDINTHNYTMSNGKHKGELITRLPVSYLKWMVCIRHAEAAYAQAELDRRGTTTPDMDISGHAIDRASQCCLEIWKSTREGNEGLNAWLIRMAAAALSEGVEHNGKRIHAGMQFAFKTDGVWPVLMTVMRAKEKTR